MQESSPSVPWWRQLSGYHWFVFIIASAAWFFDCLDQRLFSLARIPALSSLMGLPATNPEVQAFGKVVTAWFLIGWGVGGMIFGALGDRYGRAKMLTVTILIYSGCTGLTFFSATRLDFTILRFLTGLGVGGVFGLAVALIAETVPSGARAQALGLLQVLSTVGNVAAGFCKMGIDALMIDGTIAAGSGWRWMFLIGAAPALLILFSRNRLKEPEGWLKLKEEGRLPKGSIFAPYVSLMRDRRWRRNLIVGALLASTGVVGLWGIGEYAVDLQSAVFSSHYQAQAPAAGADMALWVKANVERSKTWAYLLQMLGAAVGMWAFTQFTTTFGRRPAFFIGFSAALMVTFFAYWRMNSPVDAYWMMFLMGAAQFGVFAGFAIYLPELFPSRLRSTGISFCYNLGRFAAAAGSFFSSALTTQVFGQHAAPLPYRYSAMTMCAIFLIGIITVFFAPETKGQPLPEDDAEADPAR
ncbi:MAG TPA: MFS transporter [Chthoniobacteraceae bacterium]|jgi:MFS family permease